MAIRGRGKKVTPGTKGRKPGKRNDSRTQVDVKRWSVLLKAKCSKAPKELSGMKLIQWAETELKKEYKLRTRGKKL